MGKVIVFQQANGEAGLCRPNYAARRRMPDDETERDETDDEVAERCLGQLPDGATQIHFVDEADLPADFDHVFDGTSWELTAPAAARQTLAYREERAEQYRARLGKRPGNGRQETIGDVLDAVLDFVDTGVVSPELARILSERAAIKTEIPKPPEPPS